MNLESAEQLQNLLEDGRLHDALALVDYELGDAPDEAPLLAFRALILSDLTRREEAASAARRARELDPDNPFVHFTVGEVALAQGEVHAAILAAQAAQQLWPEYLEAVLLEARARTRSAQWPKVVALTESVLERDPGNETAAMLHAVASEAPADQPLSPERWEALASRFPLNSVARAGRAWTRLNAGDARAAETEFRQALSLNPSLDWAREGLVLALKARNPVYRALLRCLLALNRLPQRTRTYLVIGAVLGFNVLRRIAQANPELKPFLFPILAAYVVFVLLSWLADPLLNLLLMLRADAREHLSEDDKEGATLVAAALGTGAALAVLSQVGSGGNLLPSALLVGAISLTLSAAYQVDAGPRRTRQFALAGLTAALAIAAPFVGETTRGTLIIVGLIAVALSTWMNRFGAPD